MSPAIWVRVGLSYSAAAVPFSMLTRSMLVLVNQGHQKTVWQFQSQIAGHKKEKEMSRGVYSAASVNAITLPPWLPK